MIPAFIFSDKIQILNKEINVIDAELFEKAKQELAHSGKNFVKNMILN